jgi:arylsulfatase A-like enzyme
METDWSVGEILKAVEEAEISENTLIIFTADNGHSNYTGWEKLVDAGHLPSGPFRGHKGNIWEGGHRVPFIARWNGKIPNGSFSDQLICLSDIYATCLDLVSGHEPESNQGEDSFSFLDILLKQNGKTQRDNVISHSVNGEFAYRRDGWKIVFKLPESNLEKSRGKAAKVELYHLEYDIAERFDSASFYPQKVDQLTGELRLIIERGTSREREKAANDVRVSFDTIQRARWAKK